MLSSQITEEQYLVAQPVGLQYKTPSKGRVRNGLYHIEAGSSAPLRVL